MRIAIAGSSGLIGTALVTALESAGHEPVPMVRGEPGPGEIAWDPTGGAIDAGALAEVDAVVNLAGEPIGAKRWTATQKRRIRDSRVLGTRLIATTMAGLQHGPRVLLNGSAIGVYGDRGDEHLDEASPPGEGFLADVVQEWEAATAPAAEAGVRVVNLRTGIVLHRRGGALARMVPLFRLGLGGRLGSGRFWMSWISLHDEVAAIVHLLHSDLEGPVNLVSPNPARNRELTAALGSALSRPTVLPVPGLALRVALGEMVEDLLASARVEPAALMASGFDFTHPDLAGALRRALDD